MMVFGEIIEPSSRAYIDDDLESAEEYSPPKLEWTGDSSVLNNVDTLIFIECTRIKELFQKFVLENISPSCILNKSIYVYTKGNHVVISYEQETQLTTGEIVQALSDAIRHAKRIYTITSAPLASYQGQLNEYTECFIRMLRTKHASNFAIETLGAPNLITGLGANVLSYCIFTGMQCSSFIYYFKNAPIDSINSAPIIELTQKIGLNPNYYNLKIGVPSNNLYM